MQGIVLLCRHSNDKVFLFHIGGGAEGFTPSAGGGLGPE